MSLEESKLPSLRDKLKAQAQQPEPVKEEPAEGEEKVEKKIKKKKGK